jgi:hypothetical protein
MIARARSCSAKDAPARLAIHAAANPAITATAMMAGPRDCGDTFTQRTIGRVAKVLHPGLDEKRPFAEAKIFRCFLR